MKEKNEEVKNVSRPSSPPDELAQNVSKKIPFGRIIPPFFLRKFRIWPFFNYLHDSNSICRAQGTNSEIFFGRTVPKRRKKRRLFDSTAKSWTFRPPEALWSQTRKQMSTSRNLALMVHLLEESPSVLSLERLCNELGSSYSWPSRETPRLSKGKKVIECSIKNFVSVGKSDGRYIKTTRMCRTSSRRCIRLHAGQNGRCTNIIEITKVKMSRYLDTSTTTQMA